MKKLLLFFALIVCAVAVKAQGVHYKQFVPNSSQSTPQQQVSTVRTNAYFEASGEYHKLPIKVAISEADTYNMERIQVVAYYRDNGYGGSWQDLPYSASVSKCNSGFAYGNELEKQFMFKANVQGRTVYFDL